jgi:hypothetical protein
MASILLLSIAMREFETGILMMMVCAALYLQTDPMVLRNLAQIVVRLIGWSSWRNALTTVRLSGNVIVVVQN